MKNVFVALMAVLLLAGCSKSSQFTQDITGSWFVYKVTNYSIQIDPTLDSVLNDSIIFTSGGQYVKTNIIKVLSSTPTYDTVVSTGKWQFQNSYGSLVMTDTSNVQQTFTMLNLTGNSVELLRNGYDYYLRKN